MSQKRDAAIVGIHEYPSRDVEGEISPLQIKAESAAKALSDAGLNWSDVDAIYDAGDGGGMSGLNIAEYFGLNPNVIDTTGVGGSSYEFHAAHAKRDIAAGKAKVALLTYGSTAHSNARAIGVGGRGECRCSFFDDVADAKKSDRRVSVTDLGAQGPDAA